MYICNFILCVEIVNQLFSVIEEQMLLWQAHVILHMCSWYSGPSICKVLWTRSWLWLFGWWQNWPQKRWQDYFSLWLLHGKQEASLHNIILSVVIQQGFGRADHSETVRLLKEHFPDYGDQITFRNEGYWIIMWSFRNFSNIFISLIFHLLYYLVVTKLYCEVNMCVVLDYFSITKGRYRIGCISDFCTTIIISLYHSTILDTELSILHIILNSPTLPNNDLSNPCHYDSVDLTGIQAVRISVFTTVQW